MSVRKFAGEFIGSAGLLIAVVGSGILAERLAGGNAGVALLGNSIATGGALVMLILTFAPLSGAHFNPAVSVWAAVRGHLPRRLLPGYIAAQIAGAFAGVALAHLMFGQDVIQASQHVRATHGELLGEVVATFGLILVIDSLVRQASPHVAFAVAGYITGAYWFTASTAFANPAVTLARAMTDTFAGIRPSDVPGFLLGQALGLLLVLVVTGWLFRDGGLPEEVSRRDVKPTRSDG